MKFFKTSPKRDPLQPETAEVSVQSIIVEFSQDPLIAITARYLLHANLKDDRRPVLIDFLECPLWLVSIEGTVIESLIYDEEASPVVDRLLLSLRAGGVQSWENAQISIKLKWTRSAPHPPLFEGKYLFLPANLPSFDVFGYSQAETRQQIPVSFRGETDHLLVGAIPASLNGIQSDNPSFIQAILARSSAAPCTADQDRIQVRLLECSRTNLSKQALDQICSQVRQVCAYLGERLQAYPALRIAAVLDSSAKTGSMPGALLTQPPESFRLPQRDQSGNENSIARAIATNWWGEGCQIAGPSGLYLAGGISFALGLTWTQDHTSSGFFETLLASYQQRVVLSSPSIRSEFRPGERSIGIGLVLYEALMREPGTWKVLQQLTLEFWGCYAAEEVVLRRMREAGVPIGDFDRKRFLRD